ncbi:MULTISPECIES: alpha/beta hydrolase [Sutcliffiella]|uniref:Carboxylesterase n=1 Tax=Sutcliffiella cohnii TaxID=33932 RepID=A0A223KQW5_9BACI|nr:MULTISPECIES: alpha/beta hydrolase [Sutcliffiella]AST91777.1 carboxylesterase [Sutcliffiella cohnii]WBL12996.1 alpha/beta hydrolase [Sutcliffiella sp. NC1]
MKLKHIFQQGSENVLLLLHGTGGNEQDLIPLAGLIDPNASILSVRGNVLENGMPRFFRRLSEGIFDEQDLIARTEELYLFLEEASKEYGFDRKNVIALGYSNGANIAGSLLFHYKEALKGAILFHPMVPRRGIDLPNMSRMPIFIGAGVNDPICPASETEELKSLLESSSASVQLFWENYGHQLTRREVEEAQKWYENNIK